jgi:AbrB family looped-hinge helix DNA binding protein
MLIVVSDVGNKALGKARLSSRGRLTVPPEIRRMLGLTGGDRVVFELRPE